VDGRCRLFLFLPSSGFLVSFKSIIFETFKAQSRISWSQGAVKGGTKLKSGPYAAQEKERKIARPLKLKPLKEILKKLIMQIQR